MLRILLIASYLIASILSHSNYSASFSIIPTGFGTSESEKEALGYLSLGDDDQVEWININHQFSNLISNNSVSEGSFLRIYLDNERLITGVLLKKYLKICYLLLNLMLDESNHLYHASLSISDNRSTCGSGEQTSISIKIKRGQLVNSPHLTKPVSIAQDGPSTNQSFLGKYWYYILPIAILFLVTTPAE